MKANYLANTPSLLTAKTTCILNSSLLYFCCDANARREVRSELAPPIQAELSRNALIQQSADEIETQQIETNQGKSVRGVNRII